MRKQIVLKDVPDLSGNDEAVFVPRRNMVVAALMSGLAALLLAGLILLFVYPGSETKEAAIESGKVVMIGGRVVAVDEADGSFTLETGSGNETRHYRIYFDSGTEFYFYRAEHTQFGDEDREGMDAFEEYYRENSDPVLIPALVGDLRNGAYVDVFFDTFIFLDSETRFDAAKIAMVESA